jgi:hypothetical protein
MKHAELSASGSSRWLNCPGSNTISKRYPKQQSSPVAQEGSLAHKLAEICLNTNVFAGSYANKEINGSEITQEMADYVQEYLNFIRSYECKDTILYIEKQVNFSNVVPKGFGTLDCAILDKKERICHIIDLKYGRGVKVNSYENTQGQLYAIGFANDFGTDDIDTFRIHIVQPRMKNFSSWDISLKDLKTFGEYVSERAGMALRKDAPKIPGEVQCQWCPGKGDCRELYKLTQKIITKDFSDLDRETDIDVDILTDSEKKTILDNKKFIESFLKGVESSIYNTIDSGAKFKGYKFIQGRSTRRWDKKAQEVLVGSLGKDAYKKSLIGVVLAEKTLGKDVIDSITTKPPGKIKLVRSDDKRQEVDVTCSFENLD